MLFIVSWTARPEHRDAATDRFLKTGGMPPDGAKLISRWHAVGPIAGFAIAEASDAAVMQKWVLDWSDLLSMEVHVAVTDEQLGPLLAAVRGKA